MCIDLDGADRHLVIAKYGERSAFTDAIVDPTKHILVRHHFCLDTSIDLRPRKCRR